LEEEKTMKCPKCGSDNIKLLADHYFCNVCLSEFEFIIDEKKFFPYNCIFPKRPIELFYREPYYDYTKTK
jgi:DNA-directed RNA polymerase subunit RPC12/RpoP